MKILITLASLDIGGAETHVAELASELNRRGYDIIVASGGGVYAEQLEKAGIKHYTVPLARRKISDMLTSRTLLKKIIRTEKPDIVHAHARIPAFIVSTLKKCCNFVFVTTVHGAFDTSFILRHLSGWGVKTLAVSEDLKNYLLENYDVKEENIYTSINGISSEKFNKNIDAGKVIKEFDLTDNANRICYVSRLSDGICSCAYMLIDEFTYIAKNVPNAQLLIVGGGEHFDALKEKADEVNNRIGRRAIILTGPRTDVNEVIATSSVCVGVSRAILEPMAMERLCIVAGDPGYIGIMTEDKLKTAIACNFTCRGCAPVNSRTMADDIISLFNLEHADAEKLRTFAGDVVLNHYSIDKMVSDNEQMYSDAMRQHGSDAAILGYYGYGNCGDDALLHAILKDIYAIRPYFSPTVLSYKPAITAQDYGVHSINRFDIFAVRKLFNKVKLFIAGGGSLIQDVTSTKSLLYYLYIIRLAKKKGVPVMLYGNGIGPINKPLNKKLAAKVLNTVDVITLRDYESLQLLESMGVTAPEIKITADPALSLTVGDTENAKQILKKYGLKNSEKFFCLSVRRWKNMGNAAKSFADICARISAQYGLTPVIVPMQYSKDMPVSREIAELAGCRSVLIDESLTADDILAILNLSEAAVTVRLHMLIFGTLLGVPVLGVDYDPKVSSFEKFAGLERCLTPDSLTNGTYVNIADEFFAKRSEIAQSIGERLPSFKDAARENARIAVELIEHER
ncbi:MAG: polysaccharide pyruvyl transferase CsaB [Clostridia bacterium]|nr:polysaccharide pyruvyl transferase CsaB [Clostridia bacterium]